MTKRPTAARIDHAGNIQSMLLQAKRAMLDAEKNRSGAQLIVLSSSILHL